MVFSFLHAKHAEGFELTLWSMRGEEHAKLAAHEAGCTSLFTHILGKPGYIIDDKNWQWCRDVPSIKLAIN